MVRHGMVHVLRLSECVEAPRSSMLWYGACVGVLSTLVTRALSLLKPISLKEVVNFGSELIPSTLLHYIFLG